MLFVISKAVGFDFTKEHLQRGIYYPTGHAEIEADRRRIRRNAAAVLSGSQPLKMEISSFPVSSEMVRSQLALQGELISAIGDAGLRVEIAPQLPEADD
ncbi:MULTISPECIES: DUF6680 family protein [Bradyrhizobium]|uniref:DUF6680 family protein n=1 Tax=Bradyrhizobium TaxID=374 RepID=UPI002814E716|nr:MULTISPECIES: DUF6680 family protein [Bradyrhizobium]